LGFVVGFARHVAVAVEAASGCLVCLTRSAHAARDDGAKVAMDTAKVDLLLKYALAVASQADREYDRRLGKIHLLKYVYLADLAYAEKNGVSFTNVPWRFYHYGPWDAGVCNRIEPVLESLDAEQFVWESAKYDTDTVRWSIDSDDVDDLIRDLDKQLPFQVTLAIRRAVHEFGNNTSALLHNVYTTAPMLHAAPNQLLDFSTAKASVAAVADESDENDKDPTIKEQRRRREAMIKLKDRFQAALSSSTSGKRKAPVLKPIYDDVFVNGARQVEALAGPSPDGISGDATLSEDIWTSEGRKRGRLP
jgi:hypothetical protein